jgi:hypothetical protein
MEGVKISWSGFIALNSPLFVLSSDSKKGQKGGCLELCPTYFLHLPYRQRQIFLLLF